MALGYLCYLQWAEQGYGIWTPSYFQTLFYIFQLSFLFVLSSTTFLNKLYVDGDLRFPLIQYYSIGNKEKY